MRVLNRSQRIVLNVPEALEIRALMSVGGSNLPRPLHDGTHGRFTAAEIQTIRHDFRTQWLANHPHAQAALEAAHPHDSADGDDSNGESVDALKVRGRASYRYGQARYGLGFRRGRSGGTGAGGGTPVVSSTTMTPATIRHAYGFDQESLTGAGQTIAIVDAYDDPNIVNDVAVFDQKYNLPAANLIKSVPRTGTPAYSASWSSEIALDVEWAHAIAPGAKILLVEAASASYSDLLSAVDSAVSQGAKVISMSWGGAETTSDIYNNLHFNHPGVTFVASSGDNGAGTISPASSPYVVSVGGTTLNTDASGNRLSETAWSGSGGGISTIQSRPTYQNGFTTASKRSIPDVSYDANPSTGFSIYDSSGGGWGVVGGTSAGAPQWAGLFALVNQGRAAEGKASIGTDLQYGTDTALYALAGKTSYTNPYGDYLDVTAGSNGYSATTGYDDVTGLGSPVANKLIPGLINF